MTDVLTDQELFAFAADELDRADIPRVSALVAGDPAAIATIARYRTARAALAGTTAPSSALLARLRLIARQCSAVGRWWAALDTALHMVVATLVHDSRHDQVALRDDAASGRVELAFETGGMDVDLIAHPNVDEDAPAWRLRGQIDLDEPRPVDVALTLPSGEAVTEVQTDEHGHFRIDAAAGIYELFIRLDDHIVRVPDLDLR